MGVQKDTKLFLGKLYQGGVFDLFGGVNTMIAVGSGTVSAVGMTDDEALAAELAARIEAYGGLNAYCRDFDVDKRNFARYLKGSRVPGTPQLMQILRNLGVPFGEFFESADRRTHGETD